MPRPDPPTLAGIARAANVSVASVSKALSPHADRCDISAATRQRIRQVALGMGWTGAPPARSRPRRRFGNIGLLYGNHFPPTTGAYEGFFRHAALALERRGFRLLFTPTLDVTGWRQVQLSQRLDGALVVGNVDECIIAELAATAYPAVMVNLASAAPIDQVQCDDGGGAHQLVAHLAGLGCRRIVYVCAQPDGSHISVPVRRAALGAAAAGHGLGFAETPLPRLPACLAAGAGPLGLVSYDASPITEVVLAVRRSRSARIRAIACWNAMPWLALLDPPVIGVDVPLTAMADRAIDLLIARLDGRAGPPVREALPQRLVIPPAG